MARLPRQSHADMKEENARIGRAINEQEDLRDLISEMFPHLPARAAGGNALVLPSPFRDERTPSFYAYRDHYHDFGGGGGIEQHGTITDFLLNAPGSPFEGQFTLMVDHFRERYGSSGSIRPLPRAAARTPSWRTEELSGEALVRHAKDQRAGVARMIDIVTDIDPAALTRGYAYLTSRGIPQRVAEYCRVVPLVIESRSSIKAVRDTILGEVNNSTEDLRMLTAAGLVKNDHRVGDKESIKPHFVWDAAALIIHPTRQGEPFHWSARRLNYETIRASDSAGNIPNPKYFNASSNTLTHQGEVYHGAVKIPTNRMALERIQQNPGQTLYVVEGALDAYAGAAVGGACIGLQGRVAGRTHMDPDSDRTIREITRTAVRSGLRLGVLPDADEEEAKRTEGMHKAQALADHWRGKGIDAFVARLEDVVQGPVHGSKDLAELAQQRTQGW